MINANNEVRLGFLSLGVNTWHDLSLVYRHHYLHESELVQAGIPLLDVRKLGRLFSTSSDSTSGTDVPPLNKRRRRISRDLISQNRLSPHGNHQTSAISVVLDSSNNSDTAPLPESGNCEKRLKLDRSLVDPNSILKTSSSAADLHPSCCHHHCCLRPRVDTPYHCSCRTASLLDTSSRGSITNRSAMNKTLHSNNNTRLPSRLLTVGTEAVPMNEAILPPQTTACASTASSAPTVTRIGTSVSPALQTGITTKAEAKVNVAALTSLNNPSTGSRVATSATVNETRISGAIKQKVPAGPSIPAESPRLPGRAGSNSITALAVAAGVPPQQNTTGPVADIIYPSGNGKPQHELDDNNRLGGASKKKNRRKKNKPSQNGDSANSNGTLTGRSRPDGPRPIDDANCETELDQAILKVLRVHKRALTQDPMTISRLTGVPEVHTALRRVKDIKGKKRTLFLQIQSRLAPGVLLTENSKKKDQSIVSLAEGVNAGVHVANVNSTPIGSTTNGCSSMVLDGSRRGSVGSIEKLQRARRR
eukprot:Filipodium_phascolosomae@DN6766_c0_g1_i1.p1